MVATATSRLVDPDNSKGLLHCRLRNALQALPSGCGQEKAPLTIWANHAFELTADAAWTPDQVHNFAYRALNDHGRTHHRTVAAVRVAVLDLIACRDKSALFKLLWHAGYCTDDQVCARSAMGPSGLRDRCRTALEALRVALDRHVPDRHALPMFLPMLLQIARGPSAAASTSTSASASGSSSAGGRVRVLDGQWTAHVFARPESRATAPASGGAAPAPAPSVEVPAQDLCDSVPSCAIGSTRPPTVISDGITAEHAKMSVVADLLLEYQPVRLPPLESGSRSLAINTATGMVVELRLNDLPQSRRAITECVAAAATNAMTAAAHAELEVAGKVTQPAGGAGAEPTAGAGHGDALEVSADHELSPMLREVVALEAATRDGLWDADASMPIIVNSLHLVHLLDLLVASSACAGVACARFPAVARRWCQEAEPIPTVDRVHTRTVIGRHTRGPERQGEVGFITLPPGVPVTELGVHMFGTIHHPDCTGLVTGGPDTICDRCRHFPRNYLQKTDVRDRALVAGDGGASVGGPVACAGCGGHVAPRTTRRCGGCALAVYCSEGCYRANWGRHRGVCAQLRDLVARDEQQRAVEVARAAGLSHSLPPGTAAHVRVAGSARPGVVAAEVAPSVPADVAAAAGAGGGPGAGAAVGAALPVPASLPGVGADVVPGIEHDEGEAGGMDIDDESVVAGADAPAASSADVAKEYRYAFESYSTAMSSARQQLAAAHGTHDSMRKWLSDAERQAQQVAQRVGVPLVQVEDAGPMDAAALASSLRGGAVFGFLEAAAEAAEASPDKTFKGLPGQGYALLHQLLVNAATHPNQRRWSELAISVFSTLRNRSPAALEELRRIFVLPSCRQLRRYRAGMRCDAGVNHMALAMLAAEAHKRGEAARHVYICVDGMHIKPCVDMDQRGKVWGVVYDMSADGVSTGQLADEVIVFMAIAAEERRRAVVIAEYPVYKPTASSQTAFMCQVLFCLSRYDLTPRAVVFDSGSCNTGMVRNLASTSRDLLPAAMPEAPVPILMDNPFSPYPLFFMHDVGHVVKTGRNNMWSSFNLPCLPGVARDEDPRPRGSAAESPEPAAPAPQPAAAEQVTSAAVGSKGGRAPSIAALPVTLASSSAASVRTLPPTGAPPALAASVAAQSPAVPPAPSAIAVTEEQRVARKRRVVFVGPAAASEEAGTPSAPAHSIAAPGAVGSTARPSAAASSAGPAPAASRPSAAPASTAPAGASSRAAGGSASSAAGAAWDRFDLPVAPGQFSLRRQVEDAQAAVRPFHDRSRASSKGLLVYTGNVVGQCSFFPWHWGALSKYYDQHVKGELNPGVYQLTGEAVALATSAHKQRETLANQVLNVHTMAALMEAYHKKHDVCEAIKFLFTLLIDLREAMHTREPITSPDHPQIKRLLSVSQRVAAWEDALRRVGYQGKALQRAFLSRPTVDAIHRTAYSALGLVHAYGGRELTVDDKGTTKPATIVLSTINSDFAEHCFAGIRASVLNPTVRQMMHLIAARNQTIMALAPPTSASSPYSAGVEEHKKHREGAVFKDGKHNDVTLYKPDGEDVQLVGDKHMWMDPVAQQQPSNYRPPPAYDKKLAVAMKTLRQGAANVAAAMQKAADDWSVARPPIDPAAPLVLLPDFAAVVVPPVPEPATSN